MRNAIRLSPVSFFLCVLCSASGVLASGSAFAQQAQFAGGSDAFFGYAVAIDGDTAVVGAMNDGNYVNDAGTPQLGAGAAYVYVRSGTNWSLQKTLTAPGGAAGDQFGYAVAVKGDVAAVGAIGANSAAGAGTGAVYMFSRSGTTWSAPLVLSASDGQLGDSFGASLGLDSGALIVGAPGHGATGQGAAYFFVSAGGWHQVQEFTGQQASENYGAAVALSGTAAIVGAPFPGQPVAGEAFVLSETGSTWTQQALPLTASDGAPNDQFGASVAMAGAVALVGAPKDVSQGPGKAYAFVNSGSGWSAAGMPLVAPDHANGDQFGISVALSSTTAVVGANAKKGNGAAPVAGAAYFYTQNSGTLTEQQEFGTNVGGDNVGWAVAAGGSTVVVGAFGVTSGVQSDSGAAFIFAPPSASVPALGHAAPLLAALIALAGAIALWPRGQWRRGLAYGSHVVLAFLTAIAAGCSGEGGKTPGQARSGTQNTSGTAGPGAPGTPGDPEGVGSVGMQLLIPGGANLGPIAWTIAGPGGAPTVVRSGTVQVLYSNAIMFVVADIPAGTGYVATLTATSTNGSVRCAGSSAFDISAGATTSTSVLMQCSSTPSGAHVTQVTGTAYNCGAWNTFNVSPIETAVGGTIALSATATGPSVPDLTYSWSTSNASVGTLSATTQSGTGASAGVTFTCAAPGTTTITLTVGDGPVPDGGMCNPTLDTTSMAVRCDPGASDAGAPGDAEAGGGG
jgi:hypothetical protein